MIPGAEDEILKPDRMLMLQQEQQQLHRSVSEGHLLKTQISIKEEVNLTFFFIQSFSWCKVYYLIAARSH